VALVDGPKEAVALANAIAPEHLELLIERDEALALLSSVRFAGAVFCGPLSPASMGDYLAGPNHVLPTARTARFSSALRVDDFRVHIHAVCVGPDAIARLEPHVSVIAEAEGLPAHALSVRLRSGASDPSGFGSTP
jgi:histidinol dehydrogenase